MLETPVLFLIFNRPDTTNKVFETIKAAKPKMLFVAADGPRKHVEKEAALCERAKTIVLNSIDWDCEVFTLFREENLGCKDAISEAITWFFEHVEAGIILEDDCLPSQSFFPFCEILLEKYKNEEQVLSICGFSFFNNPELDDADYFFNRLGGIWGWATWRRAWNLYQYTNTFERKEYNKLNNRGLADYYWNMARKSNDNTWDLSWFYNRLCRNGISINPFQSLIQNIGTEGTHMNNGDNPIFKIKANYLNVEELNHPELVCIKPKIESSYYNKIIKFFKLKHSNKLKFKRIVRILKGFIFKRKIPVSYVFGDSHTEVFQYIDKHKLVKNRRFNVTLVGGATAQGMRNPNSKTNSLGIFSEKIKSLKKTASLIFLLGEVDTGFVIWYRATKYNESIDTQLQQSIDQYFDFLCELKKRGFHNITIVSAPLPTIQDNQDWGEVANARSEVKATQMERTKLTIRYNNLLSQKCRQNDFKFLNTDDRLLDKKTNIIKERFLNKDRTNHHLDLDEYSKIIIEKI